MRSSTCWIGDGGGGVDAETVLGDVPLVQEVDEPDILYEIWLYKVRFGGFGACCMTKVWREHL
jgi:hypothetical protein